MICFIVLIYTYAAALISTNNGANVYCPGEKLIFTCTSESSSQRWRLLRENDILGVPLTEHTFLRSNDVGTVSIQNNIFNFTLTHVSSYLESTFSTVATRELNNTIVECTSPRDTVKIRIIGML